MNNSELQRAITRENEQWKTENKIQRLWDSDATLWTNHDEAQWTGWLTVITAELNEISRIEKLAHDIKTTGFKHIVLLGMGGSSLCPDMMTKIFGEIKDYPRLHILDSTDPDQIFRLENNIDLNKTIFIVSSKSGSTLEPNIFKDYFYSRLQIVLGKKDVGDRFIAITDPNTTLDALAKKENFKAIFYGIPSIGGRYSALSNFGMVPAGLMGIDIKKFLQHAELSQHNNDNSGVLLGITLGICAKNNKDKVTLILSPEIQPLGAWLEQLLAESTGKMGKGLIPVDNEPLGSPDVYGDDRVFVYIRLENMFDAEQDRRMTLLEKAGHVVVRLSVTNKYALGAELFRWEIATAVAGSILGINPFNQPDVEASKVQALHNISAVSPNITPPPSFDINTLLTLLSSIKPGDYVDICAFIEMSDEHRAWLQKIRTVIRDTKKVATCVGFGPRFLHSTGQLYKGGPNTGVFLQITADHNHDIHVPHQTYTFGAVINAQAQADYEVLLQRKRRILRIHVGHNILTGLQQLCEFLQQG